MNGTLSRDDLLKELGLESLPPDVQDEIIAGVGENTMTHVLTQILGKLPPDAQEKFKALIDEGRGVEADTFAREHISDLDAFIAQETRAAIDEFKSLQQKT